jgi:hypothetical protein
MEGICTFEELSQHFTEKLSTLSETLAIQACLGSKDEDERIETLQPMASAWQEVDELAMVLTLMRNKCADQRKVLESVKVIAHQQNLCFLSIEKIICEMTKNICSFVGFFNHFITACFVSCVMFLLGCEGKIAQFAEKPQIHQQQHPSPSSSSSICSSGTNATEVSGSILCYLCTVVNFSPVMIQAWYA